MEVSHDLHIPDLPSPKKMPRVLAGVQVYLTAGLEPMFKNKITVPTRHGTIIVLSSHYIY